MLRMLDLFTLLTYGAIKNKSSFNLKQIAGISRARAALKEEADSNLERVAEKRDASVRITVLGKP